jgi:hypothetical protein
VTQKPFCKKLQRPKLLALIRVHDGAGNVIETHEHKGDFKESSA